MAVTSITLARAKRQCRILDEDTTHDTQVAELIASAEKAAVRFCNVGTLDDLATDSPGTALPEDVLQALAIHVQAHFDTDPVQMGQLLEVYEGLLWPHRQDLGV
jgi:hypothetical protein